MSDYDLASVVAYVNGPGDRYPKLCRVLADLFGKVKLHGEDKQEVLSDVSDILDGIKPSARSGFVDAKISQK